jgi:hypothetical protein
MKDENVRFEELRATILLLDEVLTMSAQMASATGEPRWERRYHEFEPKLDAAITEWLRFAPGRDVSREIRETQAANQALVAMESEAFELVHAGRLPQAHALLSSAGYDRQKRRYATNLQAAMTRLDEALDAGLEQRQRWVGTAIAAALVALGLALFGWSDEALYRAKASGRNRVCVAGADDYRAGEEAPDARRPDDADGVGSADPATGAASTPVS